MKKSLTLLLTVTSAFFFACSDDSSSDSGNSEVIEQSGTLIVDEEKQTATAISQLTEEMCVRDEVTLEYAWKSVDFGADSNFMKYEFVGDTLVVFVYDDWDEEYSTNGQMYVGGKAGKLDGTWKSTYCSYSSEKKASTCYKPCSEVTAPKELTEEEIMEMMKDMTEEEMEAFVEEYTDAMMDSFCLDEEDLEDYPDVTIKISGTSIKTTIKFNRTEEDFDDFTNSKFMTSFIGNLISGDGNVPGFSKLFKEDSSGMEKIAKTYKAYQVEVSNQSKKNITFKFADQTLSVNFKTVNKSDENRELALDVSSGGKTCSLSEESGDVTKSTCKSEYGEYFDIDRVEGADGVKISVADEYEKSNEKGFEDCVEDMMDSLFAAIKGKGSSSDNPLCDSYKDSYDACVSTLGEGEICDEYQTYYESCLEGGEYSTPLYKKASSSAELAKKKFLKNARKIARKLEKFAE